MEMYRLLTLEGHFFLPLYKLCTIDFISDIIAGRKKVSLYISSSLPCNVYALTSDKVTVRVLLHVDGLRTRDILEFLIKDVGGEAFLPDNYCEKALDRSWLINLCRYWNVHSYRQFSSVWLIHRFCREKVSNSSGKDD